MISLKYANGLRNGANSDTHRCKQLTEHGEERCIKLREVAVFSAVRTTFQIVGPRKILPRRLVNKFANWPLFSMGQINVE